MADKAAERVLGIPADRLRQAGLFQGFRPFDANFFAFLLDPDHLEYRARGAAESDPEFKQLIPYVALRWHDQIFHYTRGKSGAETRLRALRSIGIGGHISADEDAHSADPYRAGMLRELAEEVAISGDWREQMFGLINDDATPVGTVHLGVVHVLDLDKPDVAPREAELAAAGFAPLAELQAHAASFETWSQMLMEALANSST